MSVRSEPHVEETDRFDLHSLPWLDEVEWQQLTLLPLYEVSWSEDAPCGHPFCGWESYSRVFFTMDEAERLKAVLMQDYEPDDE